MALAFGPCLKPRTAEDLGPVEREQLASAWDAYAGDGTPVEALVADNAEWFELWRVHQDGVHVYDFWFVPPDNGRLFVAGSVEPVGIAMIQHDWDGDAGDEATLGAERKELLPVLAAAWKKRSA